ncbi:hypothetical protein [Rhodopirellula baltica]|uniref:hypothetical protein n=1 Tax=Rhodopirellula baltica TaxID=265606 RepID=UPI0005668E84|nr:hypothetical protein [Rhodopirellula baltica]
MTDDAQQIWTDYYARIRRRRIAEAELIGSRMLDEGVTADTVLALDFKHFGTVESDVRRLSDQLSENYTMDVLISDDGKTWFANGTTRPYGVDGMIGDQLKEWATFMCDVANSYACVFATWKLVDTQRKIEWATDNLDIDPETDIG